MNEKMASDQAYFISPRGLIIPVQDGRHIKDVLHNAPKFGLKRDDLVALHTKYKEKLGQEGKAREEILVGLMKKGWVRIRRYAKQGWSINVWKLTDRVKDLTQQWAEKILKGTGGMKELDPYMPVNIIALQGTSPPPLTVKEISQDKLYAIESREVPEEREQTLVFVESYDQMPDMSLATELLEIMDQIDESSPFVKVVKYLKGLKDSGKGMAILTSDNPEGVQVGAETNNKNFALLKAILKKMGKIYFQQKGHYGQIEHSILIIDISQKEAATLANDERWPQDSFIHIVPDKGSMNFKMIRGTKQVSQQRIETGGGVSDLKDFFTMVKGRKFVIPFSIPDLFWEEKGDPDGET